MVSKTQELDPKKLIKKKKKYTKREKKGGETGAEGGRGGKVRKIKRILNRFKLMLQYSMKCSAAPWHLYLRIRGMKVSRSKTFDELRKSWTVQKEENKNAKKKKKNYNDFKISNSQQIGTKQRIQSTNNGQQRKTCFNLDYYGRETRARLFRFPFFVARKLLKIFFFVFCFICFSVDR